MIGRTRYPPGRAGWEAPSCRWALAVTAGAACLTLFLPWSHSGARTRNAFGLAAAALDIGVDLGALRLLAVALPLLPALTIALFLAVATDRRGTARALAMVVALSVGGTAVAVLGVGRHPPSGVPTVGAADFVSSDTATLALAVALLIPMTMVVWCERLKRLRGARRTRSDQASRIPDDGARTDEII
ncbi:MAG TPA: hypothetical protein ENI86_07260 [Acidimicrobiales bacterium]|nr:hypothetical protein [Acidimicrobiales bacterium]